MIEPRLEGSEELELDLTPGALETNDPVAYAYARWAPLPHSRARRRWKLRRIGTRLKLAVIKSISRTPLVARRSFSWATRAHQQTNDS